MRLRSFPIFGTELLEVRVQLAPLVDGGQNTHLDHLVAQLAEVCVALLEGLVLLGSALTLL